MPTLDQAATWILNRRRKILRYRYVPSGIIGVLLLVFGYQFGKGPLQLILEGRRTTGNIVGYEENRHSNGKSGFTPIVEFQANDQPIRFKNWMGSQRRPQHGEAVTVFYDAANPSHAMLDRGFLNWVPWGPSFAIGLFLILATLKHLLTILRT